MDLQPANTDWYLDPNGAPSSTWTCHLCTRTMNIFHRDSHLYSRRHLRAARVDAPPAPPPPQPFMWQCVPCGVDMNVFHRDAHLGSKQHARNTLPAAISHCLICNTVVQVEVQSGGESRLSVCVDCDGLFRDREHVDGGGEQGAEEEVGIDPGDTAEYDSDSNRDGNTDAQYDNINAYPATTPGPVQPDHPPREDDNCLYCSRAMSEGHMCGVITCEVCGVWMSRRYQAVHQFTMRHRTAVQESERRQQEDSADSDVQNEENTSPGGRHARAPEYLPQRQHVGCPHCVTTIEDEYPYFFLKSQATTHGVYCRCTICRAQSQEAVATDNHAGVEKWWTCTLCSRTMRMGSREGHLTLATHHARAQGMMKQRKGVEMFHRKLKKSKQVKAKWECELCGKEMGLGAKESHLNSRKHRKKETQMERGKGKNVIIPEPVSNNQNISAQRKKQQGEILTLRIIPATGQIKYSNGRNKCPILPAGQWHCSTCSRTMLDGSRQHHCMGRPHRRRYRAIKIQGDAPGFRRQAGYSSARAPRQLQGGSCCGCGKNVWQGDWCRACDFRADVVRGKTGGRVRFQGL